MSDMVERVALAIFDDLRGRRGIKDAVLRHDGLPYQAGFEENKDWLSGVARTVIAAMREPGEAMIAAGETACGDEIVRQATTARRLGGAPAFYAGAIADNGWRAMIDAALSE